MSNSGAGSGRPNPYVIFNNKLQEFIDDLSVVIGHLNEFKLFASSAKFLAQFQERQNQELFRTYVQGPFGTSILARDEAFLLEERYDDESAGLVAMLKGVWRSLPESDRDSIWAHLHLLMVISDRCGLVVKA